MLPNRIAFVDIETTGLSVVYDRIIEIGIIIVEDNTIVKIYTTLLNPQMYISSTIESITGISKEDLECAPTFDSVKDDIAALLTGCVFVAHNVRFDYGFLRNEFKRCAAVFSAKHFCTVKLSRKLYPHAPHHNLDSIISRFDFRCENRHRAFDDARVLVDFYHAIQKEFSAEIVAEAIAVVMSKPSIPSLLAAEQIDRLPELPGVYIFYGAEGVPLYVGKSINIKHRVLSHFTSDHKATREMNMCQQVIDIETIITAGELGALIKESETIKKLQPVFNRKLRVKRRLLIVRSKENIAGYKEVVMEEIDEINVQDTSHILGIYKSKQQAKEFLTMIKKKHILCEKLLGLEKTKSACFAYRLGACQGACVSAESALRYNMRFVAAFSENKLKSWPFTGPIVIREQNPLEELEEKFMIDKWCLLPESEKIYKFDLDIYKILVSYMQSGKNSKNIHQVSSQELRTFYNYVD